MLTCIDELFLHAPDGSVIPLRCFEGDEPPTLGKTFGSGMDTLAWTFGRHPEWCDVVWDHRLSAIHFTIFYDRSSAGWYIYDGGFYPHALKMKIPKGYKPLPEQSLNRKIGANPSTLGTFLNGKRLLYTQPLEGDAEPRKQSLYPGDRIFAAGRKIYVSASLKTPDIDWQQTWIDEPEDGDPVPPGQAQELLEQQQNKIVPSSDIGLLANFLDRRLSKAPLLERIVIYALLTAIAIAVLAFILGAS